MVDLVDEINELKEKIHLLEQQYAFRMRQMEISLYQSEMQTQTQIRSMGGGINRATSLHSASIPFSRDTAWKRLIFHKTGEPKKLAIRILFKEGGTTRKYTRKIVFKKNGSPRAHFARWLHEIDDREN